MCPLSVSKGALHRHIASQQSKWSLWLPVECMRCLPRSEEKPAEHRPTGNLKGKPQAGSLNMAWMAEEEAGSSSSCTLTGGKNDYSGSRDQRPYSQCSRNDTCGDGAMAREPTRRPDRTRSKTEGVFIGKTFSPDGLPDRAQRHVPGFTYFCNPPR